MAIPKPGSKGFLGPKSKVVRAQLVRVCLDCGFCGFFTTDEDRRELDEFLRD